MSAAAEIAVRVDHVSKMYRIYSKSSDILREMFLRRKLHKECWPLRDVSLEVRRGEVLGIIGRNGAGKSTLLRIIAGTLDRTSGTVMTRGKIAAILELGTGFHPDYTGRENAYMGGLCLGMTRAEIDRKLDSIIEFSGLADVIDQPFKTYSNGMQSRLAFATAFSVEPEVLIIDEALAAGDAFFVGRCLERITEICRSGATVLLVSHSMLYIQRLCNHCIRLDGGVIVDQGDAFSVSSRYESLVVEERSQEHKRQLASSVFDGTSEDERDDLVSLRDVTGDGMDASSGRGWMKAGKALQITSISLRNRNNEEGYVFWQHELMRIRIDCNVNKPVSCPVIFTKIRRADGVLVQTWFSQDPAFYDLGTWGPGSHSVELVFDDLLLGDGDYALSVLVYPRLTPGEPLRQAYAIAENSLFFSVRRHRPLSSLMDHPMRIFCDDKPVAPS